MKSLRDRMIKTSTQYLQGQAEKHRMNIELILSNPVAVAEHSDMMESLEKELGLMADYVDKLEMLDKYFK
jgi:hypothetical protein